MIRFLFIGLCIFFSSLVYSTDWHEYDNFLWAYECDDLQRPDNIVIYLHGSSSVISEENSVYESPFIVGLLERCSVIAHPFSGTYMGMRSWDFSEVFTDGSEITEIINIIKLAHYFWDKPVYLVGGSGGGVMSNKIIAHLVNTGQQKLLDRIVMVETIDAVGISINDEVPPQYFGLDSFLLFTYEELSYYGLNEHKYISLGLTNKNQEITIPILVVISRDDPIIPYEYKKQYLNVLEEYTKDLQIVVSGTNHKVSAEGYALIFTWLWCSD